MIPFEWWPGSWGLKGKTREIAKAEYELEGFELEIKLAEINLRESPIDLQRTILDLKKKYNKIDEYSYDKDLAELQETDTLKQLALIEVELKHQRITDQEYERRKADINQEPWIAMPKISWDPQNPTKTFFELDYNDHFIRYLRENGYQGSDDDLINRWLNDICYSVLQEIDQPEPEMINTIRKIRLPDGKTEHS